MSLPLSAIAVAVALTIAPAAFAADEINTSVGITAAGAPLALHGVDPVAFLDLGNRIEGSARHTAVHESAAYYFETAENKAAFEANPEAYLPQNGGFCTFGVSVGKKFDGDPQYAAIVDGNLYVFLNAEIFGLFQKDRAGTITNASEKWPGIEHVAAADL